MVVTVSWSPPDPPNGMIIYYNIMITHVDSGELEQLIEVFNETSIDVSDYVDSNGDYNVQVHYVHVCKNMSYSQDHCTYVYNMSMCTMFTCSSVVRCKQ